MMRTRMTWTQKSSSVPDTLGQQTSTSSLGTEIVGHIESQMMRDASWNIALAANEDLQVVIPYVGETIAVGDTITVWDANPSTLSVVFQITRIEDDRNRHRWLRLGLSRSLEAVR